MSMVNSGYNALKGRWETSEGVAQFVGDPTVAALEVGYMGPLFTGLQCGGYRRGPLILMLW